MSSESQPSREEAAAAAQQIMRSLKKSPSLQGFQHLGKDGVLRNFSSRGEVVDYKALSPEEIQLVINSMEGVPAVDSESFEKLQQTFRGVDGSKVSDEEQLLHPAQDVQPARFRN